MSSVVNKELVSGGMKWESIPSNISTVNLHSEDGRYQIMKTKQGKFRLIAFDHEPSTQFPQAEFWMREYGTLEQAAQQAEMM